MSAAWVQDAQRVLILRALGLGDFLTGVPAYRALARAFPPPEHELVLAAPAALAPLVRLVPEITRLAPCSGLETPNGVERPAIGVNLHGRGPLSHRALLATGPQRLIAFAHREVPESRGGSLFREDEHEVQRWCRMLREHGVPADPDELDLAAPYASPLEGAYVVIHPGAASGARRWPAERFARVAAVLAHAGWRTAVTGAPTEIDLAEGVASLASHSRVTSWAGWLDLPGLVALVAGARLVICGDTGISHLATALRTPSVVLFGPTPPEWWGPPPSRPMHRVLHRGGRGDPHAPGVDARLLAIQVEEVVEAAFSLLHPRVERTAAPARVRVRARATEASAHAPLSAPRS